MCAGFLRIHNSPCAEGVRTLLFPGKSSPGCLGGFSSLRIPQSKLRAMNQKPTDHFEPLTPWWEKRPGNGHTATFWICLGVVLGAVATAAAGALMIFAANHTL